MFSKIKRLFQPQTKPDEKTAPNDDAKKNDEAQAAAHLAPVSCRLKEWIEKQNWHYGYEKPDEDDPLRTHHFFLGFRDDGFYWNLVIRVYEKNQIITFQGVLPDPVEPPYFLPVMAAFTAANQTLSIGSLELDTTSGMVRAKVGIDGEFSLLSDVGLSCYMQGIVTLTEKAANLIAKITQDPNPSQDLQTVLKEQGVLEQDGDKDDGDFFMASKAVQ